MPTPVTAVVRFVVAALVVAMVAAGCSSEPPVAEPATTTVADAPADYTAELTWTPHGIVHVVADDYGSLGFGQGWAIAADRGCELADQIVKVRGQRARWHGAGDDGEHLASDITYASWDLRGRAEALWPQLSDDARAMVTGYADGFTAWLADNRADLAPWCADEPWVGPIDALDLVAYHHDLAMVASGRGLVAAVAAAAPPGGDEVPGPAAVPELPEPPAVGGTAWALGRQATRTTTSVLAVAAALPWDGELALWENHLTIPGELDVYGWSLVGLPGVFSGFNDDVAWTQVPSGGQRLTYARVELDPADPTRYRFGDTTVAMTPADVTVEVADGAGGVSAVDATVWSTVHGPVIELPGMGWDRSVAYTYRDAALIRPLAVDHVLALNRAGAVADIDAAGATIGATGWTATVAVSASGWAWVGDPSATPNVDPVALARAGELATVDPVAAAVAGRGAVLLDGSSVDSVWVTDDAAVAPGLLAWANQPRLQARDWVVATGDTHWVPNDRVVLSGFSPLVGPEQGGLSLRARFSLAAVARLVDTAVTDDRTLGAADLRAVLLENRGLLSELLVDDVVERCRDAGPVDVPARTGIDGSQLWAAQTVDLVPVCNLLERWRGRWDLDDQATNVWTEFLAWFDPAELRGAGRLFATGPDPADPIGTPSVLAPAPVAGPDPVAVALAEASLLVGAAGFDIDDFWRDVQWADRGGERIPIHGGAGVDGTATVGRHAPASTSLAPVAEVGDLLVPTSTLRVGGRPVNAGTSAVMVVAYTPDGVAAEALVVHGQSADPSSPFHVDQAYRYSDRAWRPVLFAADEVAAAAGPGGSVVVTGSKGS